MSLDKIIRKKKHLKRRRKLRDYFSALGPGVITGAADNDPAGIATYSVVGATTGFSLLWLMLFTIPMLTVVEEMSARIGVVTKKGLAVIIREVYGKKIAIFAVIILGICNLATIAADISGISAGLELVTGLSWKIFVIPLIILLGWIMVRKNYHIVSRFLFLLTPIFILYIINAFLARPDWAEIVTHTFMPSIKSDKNFIMASVGLLGTTISPYLIFWQTTEEVEEKKSVRHLAEESFDVIAGMFFSNLVFYFIIICTAATLFPHHLMISTARDAALALKPLAGSLSFALFSIGLIGSGFIAVPVLAASTAYAAADAFEAPEGLSKDIHHARFFYSLIIASLGLGGISILLNLNPIKMLYYSQILDGILMPFLIYLLIRVSDSSKLMGKYTNSWAARVIAWATITVMIFFALMLFYQLV